MTGHLLLVHPDPPPAELARALHEAGYSWQAANGAHQCAAAVVAVGNGTATRQTAFGFCRGLRDGRETPLDVLVVVSHQSIAELEPHHGLFDDFCGWPPAPGELEARLSHLLGRGPATQMIHFEDLVMNLDTYQAAVAGRPLDLTYMEYELLRFLAARPGKVFTREDLLSRVWGYDYFSGARTVDVHIRRVRAKLGEEHASLIQTVRSVGYRFGRSHWSA